jgi:beta-mannosidase
MKPYYTLLIILISLSACQERSPLPNQRQALDINWQFGQAGKPEWLPATVPGVVQSDLIKLERIPHPWKGLNEKEIQWVENESWVYRSYLKFDKKQLRRKNIDLIFEGLDTYAEVYLNNEKILSADNMFRSWRVNIKDYLKPDSNELRVVFKSPIEVNKPKLAALGYELPAGSEQGPYKVSPFTRKAPYHFGWDWGPRILTVGIWKPVYIEYWDEVRIEDVNIIQKSLTEEKAVLTVQTTIKNATAVSKHFDLWINGNLEKIKLNAATEIFETEIVIDSPKLWWPVGWGEAHLYPISVKIEKKGIVIDSLQKNIGLRTVELLQEEDSTGTSFCFKINGHRLFAKGANYIPQSHFLAEVTQQDYDSLLSDVVSANMNMLRVWGGGIYESDYFYDLCDQKGILLWQDFMFAGSMYPGDSDFIANVDAEVTEQITRLRHHPSIVHWNGNNEMEVAWFNWGWQKSLGYSPQDSAKIWGDYQALFHQLIPNKIKELTANIPYTSTSPLSNWGKPENFNHGSMHYWGVWHGKDQFEDYQKNVGRFMSEYGFQSFPDMETIRYFATEGEQDLESPTMQWHQKSYVGNGMILKHLLRYFSVPKDFPDFVAKSQATQAKGMQIAIDAHRRAKGHCWGTLYWQLNDCWPGPSWSSRDVFGRKKQLHKELAMLFAPITLLPKFEQDSLSVFLVSDFIDTVKIRAHVQLESADGEILWEQGGVMQAAPNAAYELHRVSMKAIRRKAGKQKVMLTLVVSREHRIVYRREVEVD